MFKKQAIVKNGAGIHCRPSSVILLEAKNFPDCRFKVFCDNGESNLDSILSLISLGLAKGDEVVIEAEGKDEEKACEKIAGLFGYEFDFPQES